MLAQAQAAASGDQRPPANTRVFLSYSRKDVHFTRRLAEALGVRPEGYAPDYDQSVRDPANIDSGISAHDEWWPRLKDMIAKADVMVFIVSPDSAASEVCDQEIAYARNLGKRIVPVLLRSIDFANAPPKLSALNVKIDFTGDGEGAFAAALGELCAALDLDVTWHRESRRLTELALKWEAEGRPPDRVMNPADIRATERLLEGRPRNADPPPQVLTDFLSASRARLEEEMRRLRRTTGRAFVKPAEEALRDRPCDDALRLAAAGALLARDLDLKLVPELWSTAARAIFNSKTEAILKGHSGPVSASSFSPDCRLVVTASDDTTARVWDALSGNQIALLKAHGGTLLSALFSPNGRRIATASDDATVRVWDALSGAQIALLRGHTGTIWSASFSPDGRRIVTASSDATARVWDAESGREIAVLEAHGNTVRSASYSPDGRRIVTASVDKTARVWDAHTAQEVALLKDHEDFLLSASFSPDGRRIVTASGDETGRVWDAENGSEIALLRGHSGTVLSSLFSPDGRRIATASADGTARVWDAESGKQIAVLWGHSGAVRSASFSRDGRQIVTASDSDSAQVWDVEQAILLHQAGSPSFSPDGGRIVIASDDRADRAWDALGRIQITLRAHQGAVRSASFSSDGRRIVTTSDDKTARIWDAATANEIALLKGHEGAVCSVSFSPDRSQIVTASNDGTARVWDAEGGRNFILLKCHENEWHENAFLSAHSAQTVAGS